MEDVKRGDVIEVIDHAGNILTKRALGPVLPGGSMPVVWACREDEWLTAEAEGREPDAMPWPAADVRLAGGVVSA